MHFTTTIHTDQALVRFSSYRRHNPKLWAQFEQRSNLSWLYHDQALEGVALDETELRKALSGQEGRHHSEEQLFQHIRNVMKAIEDTRLFAREPLATLSLEEIKQFHVFLADPADPAAGRYRKTEGPAAAYKHQVTRTPSISYRLRKLVEAIETTYGEMHPVRAAALMHHEFMSIWPFDDRAGTAGRLLMNYWLIHAGYPPAIIHATDRQSYYDALCDKPEAMIAVVSDALESTMRCAIAFFERELQTSMVA